MAALLVPQAAAEGWWQPNHTNGPLLSDDDYDESVYHLAKSVTGLYLMPAICIFGIAGNALTVVVLLKLKERSSTNVYLTTLAVSDTVKLLNDLLYFPVILLGTLEDRLGLSAYTLLYPYAHYVLNAAACTTAWLTVSIAVERYIFVCFPERATAVCTTVRAKFTCSAVFVSAMIVTVPFALRYEAVRDNRTAVGETVHGLQKLEVSLLWRSQQFVEPYVWTHNVLRSLVPLSVLAVMNVFIIAALRKAAKPKDRPVKCKNRVTLMLLAVMFTFMVCITPDAAMSTVFGYGYTDESFRVKAIREVTDLMLTLNSAASFPIYVTLNKVFRYSFARVFLPRGSCRRRKRQIKQSQLVDIHTRHM